MVNAAELAKLPDGTHELYGWLQKLHEPSNEDVYHGALQIELTTYPDKIRALSLPQHTWSDYYLPDDFLADDSLVVDDFSLHLFRTQRQLDKYMKEQASTEDLVAEALFAGFEEIGGEPEPPKPPAAAPVKQPPPPQPEPTTVIFVKAPTPAAPPAAPAYTVEEVFSDIVQEQPPAHTVPASTYDGYFQGSDNDDFDPDDVDSRGQTMLRTGDQITLLHVDEDGSSTPLLNGSIVWVRWVSHNRLSVRDIDGVKHTYWRYYDGSDDLQTDFCLVARRPDDWTLHGHRDDS